MAFETETEKAIYNALISRETKFTVNGVEFTEKLIEGTRKERERQCRSRAKQLDKILID